MSDTLIQPRNDQIPVGTLKSISKTNFGYDCFVGQQFSANLQTYLISYVNYVSSFYPVPVIAEGH